MNSEQFKNHVSPNQFALPGMEGIAHPTARHLRAGYSFKMEHERENPYGDKVDVYRMTAQHPAHIFDVAYLEWAGQHSENHAYYPGMIEMVETSPGPHRGKGLPTAMYKHATDTDMGQKTRPVHSSILTEEGNRWRTKVGGPGAKVAKSGRLKDYSDAPEGYHPYEHEEKTVSRSALKEQRIFNDRRMSKAGHKMLPGMENL